MKITIITNCTARKSLPVPSSLRARTLPKGTHTVVVRAWKKRLQEARQRIPAGELYKGRAFLEAMRAARMANTPLQIISAGVGLVCESEAIPSYSLTVSDDQEDSIARRIAGDEDFLPWKWWRGLHTSGIFHRSLTEEAMKSRNRLFVLALSPIYLKLVVKELLALKTRDLERFRLIGPRREPDVPEDLRHIYMPYDGRLDGAHSPIKGTESDFPQRAARHFVELLLTSTNATTPGGHRHAVQRAIGRWPYRPSISRQRLPEPELRKVIRQILRETDGQISKALRKLRDDLDIACEQSRFRKLCADILKAKE